ncbi:MAG TPA: FAD-dependent oxidoreductase, partial [Woeseiaceae bacterium]
MPDSSTVVIGAGIGGLAAAIELAAAGLPVTVLEAQSAAGGKIRSAATAAGPTDVGPTVLTMSWIFDEILSRSGKTLAERVPLQSCEILAHHRWQDGSRFNLYADVQRSIDSVGSFAGRQAADEYRTFCLAAQRAFDALSEKFMRVPQPGLLGLACKSGLRGLRDTAHMQPFVSLWRSLEKHFSDTRLRQLFARYATYCGSSPFRAPATLMLIAHAEQRGVWTLKGGMSSLATALTDAARELGVQFEFDARVTRISARGGRVTGVELADGRALASS